MRRRELEVSDRLFEYIRVSQSELDRIMPSPTHAAMADNSSVVDKSYRSVHPLPDLDLEDVDGSTCASDSEDGGEGPSRDIDGPCQGEEILSVLRWTMSVSARQRQKNYHTSGIAS